MLSTTAWCVLLVNLQCLSENMPDQSTACRQMEARVEALAQQALGTRAKLVRVTRDSLHGGPSLEAASSSHSSVSILVAAQVCHIRSSTIP